MNKTFKPFKFYAKKKEEGLSAIEIVLIVLAGLILLAGALVVYHRFSRDNEISNGVRDLSSIVSGTQAQYQGQPGFTGLDNQVLIDSKIMPATMGTTSAADPWGGSVTVLPAGNVAQFTVEYKHVPEAACNAMGVLQLGGMSQVSIDSTVLYPLGTVGQTTNTVSNVDTACTNNNSSDISWTFN